LKRHHIGSRPQPGLRTPPLKGMAVPIPSSGQGIPGKTNLPTLPHAYLARERLDQSWRNWESCRVVVVEAGHDGGGGIGQAAPTS